MERNSQRIGFINLLILLAAGGLALGLARYSNTLAGQVAALFFGSGFVIALVSFFQMGLEEKERLEKLEFEELAREKSAASLFNVGDSEVFPAQRSREQFERFILPAVGVLLVAGKGVGIYFLWKWLSDITIGNLKEPMVVVAIYGVISLCLFLLGKYSANLAKLGGQRLLRPAGGYLVLGAYVLAIVAGGIGFEWGGFEKSDLYVARALLVLLGLAASELFINLLLEIYRPRVKGKLARLVYESRLIGLLGQPEGIFSTAAQALDYQFGFKVSDTWFYRFMERSLAWIIVAQFAILVVSTSVVFIAPGEQGLLERFGRPKVDASAGARGNILDPGIHFKLPWPFDVVYRYRTLEVQSFNVGFVPKEGEEAHEAAILWTVKHYKEEFNLLVASRDNGGKTNSSSERGVPADLMTVSIPVQYQVKDLLAYAYNHTDAGALLERVATREVVRYLVGVDVFEIMSSGRQKASDDLRRVIQEKADELKLGVGIVFVGLQDIHPPVKVAPAYEAVISARQETESKLRLAEGYAAKTKAISAAEAIRKVNEAESYRVRKVADAGAVASQFGNRMLAYNASPEVFTQRAYLRALSGLGTNSPRKYILMVTNTTDSIQLNLEDKVRKDLLDIPVPAIKK